MGDRREHDEIEKLGPPYFVPRYGELTLYLMSVAFLLLLAFHAGLRDGFVEHLVFAGDPRHWFAVLVGGAGIFYAIQHVFSRRRMTSFEKNCMLAFAVLVNGIGGIAAGWHVLTTSSAGLLIVFPIWNIICSGMLLLLYRLDVVDETSIVDDDAKPREVVLGSIILVAVFAICHLVFALHWAVIYSICVTYATTLSRFVDRWAELLMRPLR